MEADCFFNYPYAAIEEALSNAVYHRAYEEREPIEVRIENVIEISEARLKEFMPKASKKKIEKAVDIIKMISENPHISIDEMRITLNVTDRTVARYISEMKANKIIERIGPDNGGVWKIQI